MRRILRELRIEITVAALLIALGIFLLTEQLELRVIIRRFLSRIASATANAFLGAIQGLWNTILNVHPSDLLGLALIVLAFVILVWRVRWRLMRSQEWAGEKCPVCGSSMRRIHRQPRDRLISVFVPVRRYRCRNQDCGWSGLRVRSAI